MSGTYASGKHAIGECARCGFVYPYLTLRKDGYMNSLVCATCYDIKHPAEEPQNVSDATALRRPAPDLDATASRTLADSRVLGAVLGFTNYFGEQ
jgi:hypothetical protein